MCVYVVCMWSDLQFHQVLYPHSLICIPIILGHSDPWVESHITYDLDRNEVKGHLFSNTCVFLAIIFLDTPETNQRPCQLENGDVLIHGESHNPEKCTTCRCDNGALRCVIESCPALACNNPIEVEGQCCPVCSDRPIRGMCISLPLILTPEILSVIWSGVDFNNSNDNIYSNHLQIHITQCTVTCIHENNNKGWKLSINDSKHGL